MTPEAKLTHNIDFNKLEILRDDCIRYIQRLANGRMENDDEEHYIFETALEIFYGKDIWNWVNMPHNQH